MREWVKRSCTPCVRQPEVSATAFPLFLRAFSFSICASVFPSQSSRVDDATKAVEVVRLDERTRPCLPKTYPPRFGEGKAVADDGNEL